MNNRLLVLIAFIVSAALARLLPHPPNVTPIAAMALFGGAYFASRKLAFLLPFAAMIVSDLLLAATVYGTAGLRSQPAVYVCLAATVAIGILIQRRKTVARVAGATLGASVLFFIGTNFAVWAFGSLYPKDWSGLVACYTAAIPFFRNSLVRDVCYAALVFGGFALVERSVRSLREQPDSVVAQRT
jgi:hypothetical protein